MKWAKRYTPPNLSYCRGREDTPADSCFFQVIKSLDLTNSITKPTQPAFALLGFCCDEGIRRNLGREGAVDGPLAIRTVLAKLSIQKHDVLCYDAGDITCTDGDLEAAQAALAEAVSLLLNANITPIILGGGHELAWGHYQGIAKVYPHGNLGIVNFDAHFDMRPLLPGVKGSSGTPFLQIAEAHVAAKRRFDYNCIGIQPTGNIQSLFATAKQFDVHTIPADDLHQGHLVKCINFIDHIIEDNEHLYVSLCLDVFATPYAPGVSAPQTLGVLPWHVLPLLRELAMSGKVLSYDIAEMSPKFDIDQRTAKLAATFIYEIIHHHHIHT